MRWHLLAASLVIFSSLIFSKLENNWKKNGSQISESALLEVSILPGLPVHLRIPAIDVDANIQSLGVNPAGEMETPSNVGDVGWFDLGPRPGESGNAVIAGHFNGELNEEGVFAKLHQLKDGDQIYVLDSNGTTFTFKFRESRRYDPGYAEEVFALDRGIHLNLVTCDGIWNEVEKSYSKRLVVFADLIR